VTNLTPGASPVCELCSQDGGEVLWQTPRAAWVLVADPDYAGYCRVIWRTHVREMTDLAQAERSTACAWYARSRRRCAPCRSAQDQLGELRQHGAASALARNSAFRGRPALPNSVWGERKRPGSPDAMPPTHLQLRRGAGGESSEIVLRSRAGSRPREGYPCRFAGHGAGT